MKHEHVYVVRYLNDETTDKHWRRYWLRVSVCEGADGCGQWFTEGAYQPFPALPPIGEPLGKGPLSAEGREPTLEDA